jgi:transcriptional regulator with XRE-family HTH domain
VSNKSLINAQSTLAANVKLARKALGLSQEELAFRAGIDRTYASQIERAIANPSLAIICSLADVLECKYQDLLKSN